MKSFPKGYVLLFLTVALLASCDKLAKGEFVVVAHNTNSPEAITLYVAGKRQEVGILLGEQVRYTVTIPVPRNYNRGTVTGPDYRRQCFPVSGSIASRKISSESKSVCSREDQIVSVDFEIRGNSLNIRASAR